MTAVIILIIIIVVVALIMISMYNSLIRLRNQVKNAWSQIDVQLKRRHDLIPNLIETVKGYMHHERDTLENITKARSQAVEAESVGEKAKAEGELTRALGKFNLVVENYPDLKANQNFIRLQDELAGTENRIAVERRRFNDLVRIYNEKLQVFPNVLLAGIFGFTKKPYFEADQQAQSAPKVEF